MGLARVAGTENLGAFVAAVAPHLVVGGEFPAVAEVRASAQVLAAELFVLGQLSKVGLAVV